MKRWQRITLVSIISVIIIFTVGFAALYISIKSSSIFSGPEINSYLGQDDIKNYEIIGNQLFNLYDKGKIKVNYADVYEIDHDDSSTKIKKILGKYAGKVKITFVSKNVIFLSYGAFWQSVDGIAVRRNNANLKKTYENTGYDEGTLTYIELAPNIYSFNAGL
ncbi:MAG: hypothetical protein WC677_06280 [Clostridia bacterium]|jgi:hypothetical protein